MHNVSAKSSEGKLNLWIVQDFSVARPLFPDAQTFERARTLHNVHEHFQMLSDGKLHCFRNNTGIRINISSLSASTLIRECVFFRFAVSIFQNWRLSHYFDLEFWLQKFLPFCCLEPRNERKRKIENFVKSKRKLWFWNKSLG